MNRMFNFENRRDIRALYGEWQNSYRLPYAKYYSALASSLLILLVPFDFVFFSAKASFYAQYHLATSFAVTLCYILGMIVVSRAKFFKSQLTTIMNTLPCLSVIALYQFFISSAEQDEKFIVTIGNIMVIFATTMFQSRFWKEQYLLNLTGIMLAIACAAADWENNGKTQVLIVVWHLTSGTAAFFFRREFVASLYEKFRHLSSIVPRRVAYAMAFSNEDLSKTEMFRPAYRYTICLCSDWRGYQTIARDHSSIDVELLFELYYDFIFKALDNIVPSGAFYADWVADELFVVFYDDQNDKSKVIENTFAFARFMINELPNLIKSKTSIKIRYDIGIASGVGRLGLQGPPNHKKTTITGEYAGIAKRFEQEAKYIRMKFKNDNPEPIIVMDDQLHHAAINGNFLPAASSHAAQTTSADLTNVQAFYWITHPKGPFLDKGTIGSNLYGKSA